MRPIFLSCQFFLLCQILLNSNVVFFPTWAWIAHRTQWQIENERYKTKLWCSYISKAFSINFESYWWIPCSQKKSTHQKPVCFIFVNQLPVFLYFVFLYLCSINFSVSKSLFYTEYLWSNILHLNASILSLWVFLNSKSFLDFLGHIDLLWCLFSKLKQKNSFYSLNSLLFIVLISIIFCRQIWILLGLELGKISFLEYAQQLLLSTLCSIMTFNYCLYVFLPDSAILGGWDEVQKLFLWNTHMYLHFPPR